MGKKTKEIIMIKVPIDVKIQNLLKFTISYHLKFFFFIILDSGLPRKIKNRKTFLDVVLRIEYLNIMF